MEQLLLWDHQLFLSINNGWQNPVLNILMPFFTRVGEIWLMALIVIPLLYLNDRKNFYKHLALFAGALLLTGIAGKILKHLVDRPRPLKDMDVLIQAHRVTIHVLGKELREHSFPSGHTLSVFSAATFLTLLFKRWAPLFFSIALLTGLSRIYVGAHFPLDVLGGMFIGITVTAIFCILTDRYYFKVLVKPSTPLSKKGN